MPTDQTLKTRIAPLLCRSWVVLVALVGVGLVGCAASSSPRLLVMGGGGKPASNQVSLEKNVNYFYRVQELLSLGDARRDVLFACGRDPAVEDVQYIAPASADAEVMRLIDVVIGPGKGNIKRYRPHEVGGGERASSPENIQGWFDEQAGTLTGDDRVLIYFTGHGGKGEKENEQNTTLHLWPGTAMRMSAFVGELDKLEPQTPVVLVMVQCYSGGFANTIFIEGDPAQGLSGYNRCGFFASVHDRPASGCTPHVNEADYKEYSSYFWAALSGEDRLGERVERPDFDGDGRTSYLEAHGYALIQSDSMDLSICTSDRLVRAVEVEVDPGEVKSEASSYDQLLAAADPVRRAVLEGLSARLGLSGTDRAAAAQELLDKAKAEQQELKTQRGTLMREFMPERTKVMEPLIERWPELKNTRDEAALRTVVEQAPAIRAMLAESDAYRGLIERLDELEAIKARDAALVSTIAHVERFLYTLETVARIDTLTRFGTAEQVEAYRALHSREMATPRGRGG